VSESAEASGGSRAPGQQACCCCSQRKCGLIRAAAAVKMAAWPLPSSPGSITCREGQEADVEGNDATRLSWQHPPRGHLAAFPVQQREDAAMQRCTSRRAHNRGQNNASTDRVDNRLMLYHPRAPCTPPTTTCALPRT